MDFKLVSKNNLGVVTALLLVILLSQGRVFNFLLDTALGRAILILFILVISYTNKILGIVSVLFIIIMFNNSDIGYLEGFTDSSSTNSTTTMSSKMPTNSKDTTTTTTTPTLTDEQKQQLMATLQEKAKEKDTSTVTSSSTTVSSGAEGFNTFETERNIQKGKQSNSIPVSSYANQSDNVEAFGTFGGKFSDSFASF
jgi:hypothetical protein